MKSGLIASLDIGSTKIVCLIAKPMRPAGKFEIVGVGNKKSTGISGGVVSSINAAEESIISAISKAEEEAKINIDDVIVNLNGNTVSSSVIAVNTEIRKKVKASDITNLVERISEVFAKNNRTIIHVIPIEYRIDEMSDIENPIGMVGNNLGADFNVISCSTTFIKNIDDCIKRCQLSVRQYIAGIFASIAATMTDMEKSVGSVILDMGGKNTSFGLVYNNKLLYMDTIPVGGYHITRDISSMFNIDNSLAERIKTIYGSLLINDLEERKVIDIDGSDVKIKFLDLYDIISARIEEIIELVFDAIKEQKLHGDIINNIILVGGGAMIPDIDAFIEGKFGKKTRIGYSKKSDKLSATDLARSPNFSASYGMLLSEVNNDEDKIIDSGFKKTGILKKLLIKFGK